MARISLDSLTSLPGIPLSVLSVPMEDKYKCQQCLQVLRKPVQAQCGHRFCVHCFRLLTRYTTSPFDCQQTLLFSSAEHGTVWVYISICFSHMTLNVMHSHPHMADSNTMVSVSRGCGYADLIYEAL